MAECDLIIKGGTVVDGTLAPRYRSDIAIKDGRIAQIGGLRDRGAPKVLDAGGLIVAPGFVDLHTHYDGQIQWDPYCTSSGWNGVTSLAIGNCGFGFAPCRPANQERAMLSMTRNEAIPYDALKRGMLWDWETFPQFLDSLDRIPKGINVLTLVPLTPLYAWVMGWEQAKSRRPTEQELGEMCRLVHEGMDAGACGWSAQVTGPDSGQRDYDGLPMITDLMTNKELVAFSRVVADRDQGTIELTTGRRLQLDELVAGASRRPVIYQNVRPSQGDPQVHRKALAWLEECNRRGLRVYGQGNIARGAHEFTFEHYNLYDNSPIWRMVTLGTRAERKTKMQDPEMRRRLRAEWDANIRAGAGFQASLAELTVAKVRDPRFKSYEGLKGGEIAARDRKHVVDAVLDLVVADDLQTEFRTGGNQAPREHLAEVLRSPYVVPGVSDGGAHMKFVTHAGFPTEILTELVRDHGLLSLEEAHHKLSYLPAFVGGFRDRGFLREGAPADIVIYDLETLAMRPSEVVHDLPDGDWRRIRRAQGYRWTLVNGQITFEDGEPTGALSGRLLRHGVA